MDHIRVLVVDDHTVVRESVRMFLRTEPCLEVVGEAESGQDAVRQAKSLKPDVVLMDLLMPEGSGVEAIAEIKRCSQASRLSSSRGLRMDRESGQPSRLEQMATC